MQAAEGLLGVTHGLPEHEPEHDGELGNTGDDDNLNSNVLPPITEVTPAHPILAPMYTHLPLNPSATMDEMPLYVNAKQYSRILKRRAARAKLENENIILPRKGYLHPSRHKWAKGRKRGPGGRFLSKQECDKDDDDDMHGDKHEDETEAGVALSSIDDEVHEQEKKRQKTV